MALDPQAKAFLDRVAMARRPSYHLLPAAEARREYSESRRYVQPPKPDVASLADRSIPGPQGPVPIRYYRPLGSKPDDVLPVLIYLHGGGWTIGDLETHDTLCRELANRTPCAVVAVDYQMGPEHKFPAALDDCVAATRWVAGQAAELGIDSARIAVGGDSAGGNLATVVALTLRDGGGPSLRFQLLVYPATDQSLDTPSHVAFADNYLLTHDNILYFRANYLRGPEDYGDWRASPLRAADLSRLPPTLIITAGFDPLRDEGKAYAETLAAAGVPVTYTCYDGMIHGFFMMGGIMEAANQAVGEAAAALAQAFGCASRGGVPVSDETNRMTWRLHGVRVVRADELDSNTPQTVGMSRAAAITFARVGAEKIWAGTVTIHANAKTGAHHHGPVESVIYVLRGKARMRWGERLEFTAEAGPGDFIYVPPFVPHQEINASQSEQLECVLLRSGQDPVVVNLDIDPIEPPEEVYWTDDLHPRP